MLSVLFPFLVIQGLVWQIEEAHLADLDWALANMGGSASKKDANEIHAAERKTSGQEGVSGSTGETRSALSKFSFFSQDDFSGFGAFLLDEGKPKVRLSFGTRLKRCE